MTLDKKTDIKRVATKEIIVEGEDDANFIYSLLKKLKINTDEIYINSIGGSYDHLRSKSSEKSLLYLSKQPIFREKRKYIAIIHDLDYLSEDKAYQKIEKILNKINQEITETSLTLHNSVFNFKTPNKKVFEIKVFVFFYNKSLEDLYLQTLSNRQLAIFNKCVPNFLQCGNDSAKIDVNKNLKSAIQAFLAKELEEVRDIGSAAKKGLINFESKSLAPLQNFLTDFSKL